MAAIILQPSKSRKVVRPHLEKSATARLIGMEKRRIYLALRVAFD